MALMVGDKQSNTLKHFCKICKKGFGCGRALGGHMRAHGLGDDGGGMDDDDDAASDWDGGGDANVPPSSQKNYALRTNSNRLKNSIRTCENCGTVFWSWKSFLEHGNGKCGSDDTADDSFVSSDGDDMSGGGGRRGCGNSSKRKRSVGTKVGSFNYNNPNCSASNEDEDLANCLMMLSSATVEADESSALAMSKDEERRRNPNLSFMVPTSQVPSSDHHNKAKEVGSNNNNNNKGLFECKACKKVFNSHQALGGHRASHKKVKGCFAARLDNLDDTGADDDVITYEDQLFPTNKSNTLHFDHGSNNNNASSSSSKRKSKFHECSICHRVFSSGQALGGHKRCHWITSNAPDTSALARFQQFQDQIEQHMKNNEVVIPNKLDSDPIDLKLDLNVPAPSPDSGLRTVIYLPSWVGGGGERVVKEHKEDNISQSHQMDNENNGEECKNNSSQKNLNISNGSTMQNVVVVEDDEADSKVKLAKLSELKDMTEEGSSSAWLQVGIGSSTTTDVGTDP